MAQSLSAVLADFAGKTGEQGARLSEIAAAIGLRGFGAVALTLGVLLLIPLPFLPQIAGVFLLISGALLALGAANLWLPAIGAVKLSQKQTQFVAGTSRTLLGWAEDLPRPSLEAMMGGFGARLSGVAMALAGVCAFFGPAGWLVVVGLILLGFGLMEDDGPTRLIGAALCLGAGAFTLTLLGGALMDAPFANGWKADHAPWLDTLGQPAPLVPEDHEDRG